MHRWPADCQRSRGESQELYITFVSATQIRQPALVLKPRGDITRILSQWPENRTCVCVDQNIFKTKGSNWAQYSFSPKGIARNKKVSRCELSPTLTAFLRSMSSCSLLLSQTSHCCNAVSKTFTDKVQTLGSSGFTTIGNVLVLKF